MLGEGILHNDNKRFILFITYFRNTESNGVHVNKKNYL